MTLFTSVNYKMRLSNSDTKKISTEIGANDASSVIGEALRLLVFETDISPNLANFISLLELFEAFSNRNALSEQFVSRNKKVYNQEYSSQQFISEYYETIKLALPQITLAGDGFVERQFVYLFGIPVLVVANTLPWSIPESYDTQLSKFWMPGIVCVDSPDLVNSVRIEIMRVILNWFKAGNVFKKQELLPNIPADRMFVQTRRNIVEYARTEIILHLTANPGFLCTKDDFELTPYLAGTNLQQIQSIPDDFYSQFRQVIDIVKLVDSSQYKQLSRKKMCQIMYTKTDCPAILQAVKNHIN